MVQALAQEFSGRARVVKVDMDREGKVAADFESSGLPDYLVFRDGKLHDRLDLVALQWFLEGRLRRMVNGALE